jgi:flavin reductase (DIM6/NTAB) family NADH-FMN oxidoreductase RutF
MTISSEEFRDCLRHFPSGVTIVTIKSGETIHGLTVSAFASVSPDPPLILIVVDHRHMANDLLNNEEASFAVNILHRDQTELSNRFAWTKDEDRFNAGEWGVALTGAPILEDALAWMDCTIYSRCRTGTHTIYIGEVQSSSIPRPGESPLVYWNRGYRHLDLLSGGNSGEE